MKSFLSNLVRFFQTTKTARPVRRAPRRANLQLECLEDRLVQSVAGAGAIQIGSTLNVIVEQPSQQITFKVDHLNHNKLDVFDGTTRIGQFPIASIKNVNVSLVSNDAVIVDDSNGYPFAGGTAISLSGSAAGNSLTLKGNRSFSGNEIFVGGDDLGEGALLLLNTRYNFDGTIDSVTDSVKTTGLFDVQTSSGNVSLSGANGVTQTLSGLGINNSAVNTLTYSNKSTVQLEEYAANATVTLGATAGNAGEKSRLLADRD